jgi:acyl-CoA synthetase (AMP-forming)/AMP-acid ligase II
MSVEERGLLDWLSQPDESRGGHFMQDDDIWRFVSYAEVACRARRVGSLLREHGVRPGDAIAILHGGDENFVAAFFGALLVGATPAPIAPPVVFQDPATYQAHLQRLLAIARPSVALTTDAYRDQVQSAAPEIAALLVSDNDFLDPVPLPARAPDIGLLQFTSGSSGHARGVRVPLASLEGNVNAIRRHLDWTADLPAATWLPVYHDMGLIGCLLAGIVSRCDGWMLQPEQFIGDPLRWLRCFSENRAAFSASPPFGLAYVLRRVQPEQLCDMDLSGLRGLIVGAERIDASIIERFTALLEPAGFDPRAVLPAYGLAEATLAVTINSRTRRHSVIRTQTKSLRLGARLLASRDSADLEHVGCGQPLPPMTVTVVDHNGAPLPPETLGEIVIGGPGVAAGYVDRTGASSASTFEADGRLLTGDAGFLHDGELYVVGRLGDSLKVRGKAIFAEDVEGMVQRHLKISQHRIVALLGVLEGRDTAAVMIEGRPRQEADLILMLRRRLPDVRLLILEVAPGAVLRTTSGKPRRRAMWTNLQHGSGTARVLFDSGASTETSNSASGTSGG